MTDLSVIIPAYNAANFIDDAINSVIEIGNFFSIQILVVNDGSTDNTSEKLDKLARLHPTLIRVFHQENLGQSSARNLGLKYAIGEFVQFLDSDDILNPIWFKKNFSRIKSDKRVALAMYHGQSFGDTSPRLQQNYVRPDTSGKYLETTDNFWLNCIKENKAIYSICMMLIRRTVIQDMRFKVGIIHEDALFLGKLLGRLTEPCVLTVNSTAYFRRIRANSTMTSSVSIKNILGYYAATTELLTYSKTFNHRFAVRQYTASLYGGYLKSVTYANISLRTYIKWRLRSFMLIIKHPKLYSKHNIFLLITSDVKKFLNLLSKN